MSVIFIAVPSSGADTLVGWGYNNAGLATAPAGLTNVVGISAGAYHSLALTKQRRVVAWGSNTYGQTNIPSGLSNVVTISAGSLHSLALTTEGRVVGWGRNSDGQTNIPSGLTNVIAIAAGDYHSLAVAADGRITRWGYNYNGQMNIPGGLSNAVAIAAGFAHNLALTAEGRVVAWGDNSSGQTNIPGELSNVVAIAAGGSHNLVLTTDGRVVGWGFNADGQTNVPSGLINAVAIAAGREHSLALTADGRVVGWGRNNSGQTNIPNGLSNVVAIAAGEYHNLAITGDGTPSITAQPASHLAIAGATVTFRVWAAGMPPLRYQWQKDTTDLPGQTNAWLRLGGVTDRQAGNYAAIVSNSAGQSTTSVVATLTVECLLNVVATSGGSVIRSPDLPIYPGNSFVTVTATASAGYGFIRWLGDAAGTTNPLTVSMDTNKNITAVFASTAVTVDSQGVGTVTKFPDQAFYAVGEQVMLNATAGRWHAFSRWADRDTNNPRLVTIGESNRYTAVFTPTTPLESLSFGGVTRLAPVGMPAVFMSWAFIVAESVSARGSAWITLASTFPNGTLLYTLDGSEPSFAASLYSGPFRVRKTSLLRAIAYSADFSQAVQSDPLAIVILPTLTAWTEGGGSVAIEPAAGDYFSNALALVTATTAPGWTFLQWLGDATGTNPTVSISMTRNKAVRAVFGTALSTAMVGGGSIVVSPVSAWQPYGSHVRLTAVPAPGNYLAFWANAASGMTSNPLTFIVTSANPTVTAVFASLGGTQTNALTVVPNGRGQVTLTPAGHRFPRNTNVVLWAIADPGQAFTGWSGDATGTNDPLIVTMTSNTVITANFTKNPRLRGEGWPELLSQDGFRLTLQGEFSTNYRIDGSTNLADWMPVVALTNSFGTVQCNDPSSTNLSHRFYRAVEE